MVAVERGNRDTQHHEGLLIHRNKGAPQKEFMVNAPRKLLMPLNILAMLIYQQERYLGTVTCTLSKI